MADRVIMPRALDANGAPVAGARAYFYERGTSTPLTVYTDSALTVGVTTLTADANGVFATIYTSAPLKLDIWNATGDDTSLPGFPSDDWHTTNPLGVGASSVSFTPIFGNTATTVQAAIANLTALWNNVSTFGRQLIKSPTAADARTELGLGGLATLNILDEDDMASNSATRPPSQQSTKAYVDANTARQCIAYGVLDTDAPTLAWLYRDGFSAAVTDNGTGDYTVVFSTTQANAQFAYNITCGGSGGTTSRFFVSVGSRSTTGFRIYITDVNGTAADPIEISISVFK